MYNIILNVKLVDKNDTLSDKSMKKNFFNFIKNKYYKYYKYSENYEYV
jgi:hypothetical protein